jgi:membrane fusion protein (multidrug efflux system)
VRRGRLGRSMVRYFVIAAIAATALYFGYTEVKSRLTHVFEYDARITTDLVTLSSRRDGQLLELTVMEGQRVMKGDVLAKLDARIQRLEAQAIQARLASLESDRERLSNKQQMMGQQTGSRISSRNSELLATEAKRASLRAELALAQQDLARVEQLFQRKVISRARLDEARATVGRLRSDVAEAEAQMQRARGAIAETEAERGEVDMVAQEMAMLDHQAVALRAELEQKRVEIEEHVITAPIAGVVDRLFVEAGEYVRQGQRMMMMHNPDDIWVEANIKETELRLLRKGQPVHILIDAFPDANLKGSIDRIGSATTAKFALLPTPNPSGNFTKITQRVPVRINLDLSKAAELPLAPGMMVEVEIDVRE